MILDEAVVEDIVRWYVLNGGAPGASLSYPFRGLRGPSAAPWNVRATIALVLAECPFRVAAGNPFRPSLTITVVERRVIAEVAYERLCRQVGILQRMQGTDVLPATLEAQRERDLWHRMEQRYHAHPTWPSAMLWLRRGFGRVVEGDPTRGLRGDASFLPFLVEA